MARFRLKLFCVVAILAFYVPLNLCRAEYNYIDISNPFLHQIPIAIPLFKAVSGSAAEAQLSEELSGLLSESLRFTGYFKMLDHSTFLFDPQNPALLLPISPFGTGRQSVPNFSSPAVFLSKKIKLIWNSGCLIRSRSNC